MAHFAERLGSEVILALVVEDLSLKVQTRSPDFASSRLNADVTAARAYLTAIAADLAGNVGAVATSVRIGPAAETILALAGEQRAEL